METAFAVNVSVIGTMLITAVANAVIILICRFFIAIPPIFMVSLPYEIFFC